MPQIIDPRDPFPDIEELAEEMRLSKELSEKLIPILGGYSFHIIMATLVNICGQLICYQAGNVPAKIDEEIGKMIETMRVGAQRKMVADDLKRRAN